ncbi:recombination protein RecR [Candidatus Falkowbacteria bacterium]|uniref:Recombination protein RecR n=1 Tax=Candidatus Falkowbacteria bacterium CG10_big_fil_rev_8_21_14_0_10_37_18 TaxID=1974562 RepID=A0A2H0V900_9BACT|nr:recombination protein RecR [Candidatus Falkowbacteria bacterium]NCQ12687.1 recombination protein RecR [Candidatus Falkowbacteria bacterium]OIO05513.1 MAG: recombination protein RecR [Candidatus Falkowbacteria bacterium CG1_02_37_21]PIR95576.1 MAG: recombination protein RecR [Candidatus Falkowbacteria bacterium CG10_big_fil_rev_8_21_14_0_10_37_18]
MKYPEAIQNLINRLSELPSVGPKTAERYVFYLLKQSKERLKSLGNAINELRDKTTVCHSCLVISSSNPCAICINPQRSKEILCVVENTQDLAAIESTGQYFGRYFVLGGLINTIEEVRPEDINIARLVKKIKEEKVKEIILALNFTLEGETTSLYLNKILKNHIKITRLAKGLPAGSDLEYADELTLGSAIKNRREIK